MRRRWLRCAPEEGCWNGRFGQGFGEGESPGDPPRGRRRRRGPSSPSAGWSGTPARSRPTPRSPASCASACRRRSSPASSRSACCARAPPSGELGPRSLEGPVRLPRRRSSRSSSCGRRSTSCSPGTSPCRSRSGTPASRSTPGLHITLPFTDDVLDVDAHAELHDVVAEGRGPAEDVRRLGRRARSRRRRARTSTRRVLYRLDPAQGRPTCSAHSGANYPTADRPAVGAELHPHRLHAVRRGRPRRHRPGTRSKTT